MKNVSRSIAPRLLAAVLFLALLASWASSAARAQGPTGANQLYVVQYGDTLTSIATRFGVSPQALMQANAMSSPYALYVGRQMNVPYGPASAPPAFGYGNASGSFFVYTVQPGDTLFSIARRYAVSVSTLASINRIFNPNIIFAGTRLLIPRSSPIPPTTIYIVRFGDTLTGIALRFRTTVTALMIANNLANPNLIFAGMRLIIPSGTPGAPSATPSPASGTVTVSMRNNAYSPNSITVRVGTRVTWANNETAQIPHTVTSGTPSAPSAAFDSGTLNPGQTFQFTFSTPGTFAYFCRIHGAAMTGTLTVVP